LNADRADRSDIQNLPGPQIAVLFEIMKVIRSRETGFVYGVFCPDCGKACFGKSERDKGIGGQYTCECGKNLLDIDTICPNCKNVVPYKLNKPVCDKCHTDYNVERYMNIGDLYYLKGKLKKTLGLNRPFHFFTSVVRITHSKDGGKADLTKDRNIWAIDYVADIDADDIKEAHKEADKLRKWAHSLNLEPKTVYSGKKGFHLWFFADDLQKLSIPKQQSYTQEQATEYIQKIHETLKDKAKVDTQVGTSELQMIRCPYTFHCGGRRICYPLNEEQFKNFKLEIATAENVLKTGVKNRGFV
jgi:predicted RNA-binding Zn-ribbon protein involved in translation (DUF1610 family)